MTHPHDKRTIELLPLPPRRGRPSKGDDAMTGAQRQARYRAKQQIEESRKRAEARDAEASYSRFDPLLMIEDLREAIEYPDLDNINLAREAWMAYGKRMGWL